MNKVKCRYCNKELKVTDYFYGCPNCGARYFIERKQKLGATITTEVCGPETDIVQAEAILCGRYEVGVIPMEILEKRAKENIIRKFAEALEPYITYDKEYDPILNVTILKGTIRILQKDFKFYTEDEG